MISNPPENTHRRVSVDNFLLGPFNRIVQFLCNLTIFPNQSDELMEAFSMFLQCSPEESPALRFKAAVGGALLEGTTE